MHHTSSSTAIIIATTTNHVPAASYLGWSPSLEFWTLRNRKQHIEEKTSIILTVELKVSSRKNNYPFEYNNIICVCIWSAKGHNNMYDG